MIRKSAFAAVHIHDTEDADTLIRTQAERKKKLLDLSRCFFSSTYKIYTLTIQGIYLQIG